MYVKIKLWDGQFLFHFGCLFQGLHKWDFVGVGSFGGSVSCLFFSYMHDV